jgi:hypothetical protein
MRRDGPNLPSDGEMEVFLSYAWDPQTGESVPGYEEPVDAIEDLLRGIPGVVPVRDRGVMEDGDSITRFMKDAATNCELFIMIQSDKY